MAKLIQTFVLFIEANYAAYGKPERIGTLFLNRLVIDEDAELEVLKIVYLRNNLLDLANGNLTPQQGLEFIYLTAV